VPFFASSVNTFAIVPWKASLGMTKVNCPLTIHFPVAPFPCPVYSSPNEEGFIRSAGSFKDLTQARAEHFG